MNNILGSYRQYLPLAKSEVGDSIRIRAILYRHIRTFLDNLGFFEVETPILYPFPEVALMDQYSCHDILLDRELYLRVCPTEHLKRLLVSGYEAVYEIARNFRPGTISVKHLPEFTSLECTKVGSSCADMECLTETLIFTAVKRLFDRDETTFNGRTVSLRPPYQRMRVRDAVLEYANLDIDSCNLEDMANKLHGGEYIGDVNSLEYGDVLDELIEVFVLPHFVNPTFLTEFPWLLGGPAKATNDNLANKERSELYIGTFEVANMSSHLTDMVALHQWHLNTTYRKSRMLPSAATLDHLLFEDLAVGFPDGAVLGIGLDRLVMLLSGSNDIGNVVAFPFGWKSPEETKL